MDNELDDKVSKCICCRRMPSWCVRGRKGPQGIAVVPTAPDRYGSPMLKSIHHLIYTHGFVKHRKTRTPITGNFTVERKLSTGYKMQCVVDLVHQIYTNFGPPFRKSSNFLWPFNVEIGLSGGWRKKKSHNVEGSVAMNAAQVKFFKMKFAGSN